MNGGPFFTTDSILIGIGLILGILVGFNLYAFLLPPRDYTEQVRGDAPFCVDFMAAGKHEKRCWVLRD
jgi:hypothetical protein